MLASFGVIGDEPALGTSDKTTYSAGHVRSQKAAVALQYFITRSSSALNVTSPIMDEAKRVLHPFKKGYAGKCTLRLDS